MRRSVVLSTGIIAVFLGIYAIKELGPATSDKWYWIQVGVLAAILVLWFALSAAGSANVKRKKRAADAAAKPRDDVELGGRAGDASSDHHAHAAPRNGNVNAGAPVQPVDGPVVVTKR